MYMSYLNVRRREEKKQMDGTIEVTDMNMHFDEEQQILSYHTKEQLRIVP